MKRPVYFLVTSVQQNRSFSEFGEDSLDTLDKVCGDAHYTICPSKGKLPLSSRFLFSLNSNLII